MPIRLFPYDMRISIKTRRRRTSYSKKHRELTTKVITGILGWRNVGRGLMLRDKKVRGRLICHRYWLAHSFVCLLRQPRFVLPRPSFTGQYRLQSIPLYNYELSQADSFSYTRDSDWNRTPARCRSPFLLVHPHLWSV